jgi:MtfA peptidase
MIFGWFRRRRRRRYLADETPPDWSPHLEALPFVHRLSEREVQRLVGLARAFEREANFEGCGGLQLDQGIVRSISLQACRLVLYLGLDNYRKVRSVLVYPASFMADTGQGSKVDAAGLAVPDGPVLLAWDHVHLGAKDDRDGRNVVYHEFAHKLDMLDGFLDGIPSAGTGAQYRVWKRIVGKEHKRLRRATRRGEASLIDDYGATSEVEFFAEATEVFFERPARLRERHKSLYRALARFYRQDPARR